MAIEALQQPAVDIHKILVVVHASEQGPTDPNLITARLAQWHNPEVTDGRPLEVLDSKRTVEETAAMLAAAHANDNTFIEYLGGDGSFNIGVRAQEKLGLKNRTNTPGGGDACCIARELHPRIESRRWPHGTLDYPSKPHRQLAITAEHKTIAPDDPRHKIKALGFFSIGFTSEMTAVYNGTRLRQQTAGQPPLSRLKTQVQELTKHVPYDQTFSLEDGSGRKELTELAIPNGHFFAKLFRFHGLSVFGEGYGRVEFDQPFTPKSITKLFLKTMMGRYEHLSAEAKQHFMITTPDEAPFIVEADGEVFSYPSGTEFRLAQVASQVRLVTTAYDEEPELRIA